MTWSLAALLVVFLPPLAAVDDVADLRLRDAVPTAERGLGCTTGFIVVSDRCDLGCRQVPSTFASDSAVRRWPLMRNIWSAPTPDVLVYDQTHRLSADPESTGEVYLRDRSSSPLTAQFIDDRPGEFAVPVPLSKRCGSVLAHPPQVVLLRLPHQIDEPVVGRITVQVARDVQWILRMSDKGEKHGTGHEDLLMIAQADPVPPLLASTHRPEPQDQRSSGPLPSVTPAVPGPRSSEVAYFIPRVSRKLGPSFFHRPSIPYQPVQLHRTVPYDERAGNVRHSEVYHSAI